MALIPFDVFPRSMFDYNNWLSPTFDVFDPFDELDNTLARNFQWLTRPSFLENISPRFPRKYRVSIDCSGLRPESIKTNIENNKLIVTGKEESREESGDYSIHEFKKTYELPENAETDKLASFMTSFGQLVIEVPLKEPPKAQTTGFLTSGDLMPRIVDKDGGKAVNLKVSVPQNIDPSKLNLVRFNFL
jgi:HSP20 family molecular chaperone IbpA